MAAMNRGNPGVTLLLFFAALLGGCAQHADQAGTQTSTPPPAGKLTVAYTSYASMAPSNTELLYAIGAQPHLVAVCNQCDYPEAVKQLAQIGSFVSVNLEKLAQTKPQAVFLVDGQESIAEMIKQHSELHCTPVVLHNDSISAISDNLQTLGADTGNVGQAQRLKSEFNEAVNALKQTVQQSPDRPKVVLCVWPTPLMIAGGKSYLNEAVTVCGGKNVGADKDAAYFQYSTEKLLSDQPDVIIFPHEAEGQDFFQKAPWTSLQAIKNRHYFFLPAREADHLSRPTLRLIDGLYWLAERLHPQLQQQFQRQKSKYANLINLAGES
jgi:iron complex transport system substrate-binding protein